MRYPHTGRADDLLSTLAEAEAERAPAVLARKSPLAALLLPPCTLAGRLAALGLRALPAAWAGGLQDRVQRGAAGAAARHFEPGGALERAGRLLAELERGGRRAGLLCLASHPLVDEEGTGLNVELMRQGLLALRLLGGALSRPRMLAALDPFALDTFTTPREGFYAGYMAGAHLGFDRQAGLRRGLDALLMRGSSWTSAAWRLSRSLREGGGVVLMLAGGVPLTARAHYALREALGELRRRRPGARPPREAAALLGEGTDFAALRAGLRGGMRRSAWRAMESWLLSRQTPAAALEAAARGELPAPAAEAFRRCALALGFEEKAAGRALEDARAEYARETPRRARLFSFLARRVAARGVPLLLLPLRHVGKPGALSFGEAAALAPGRPFDARAFVARNFD